MSKLDPRLKPCPFCGGEAKFVPTKGPFSEPFYRVVECQTCWVNLGARFDTPEKAASAWNRRSSPEAEPVARKELADWSVLPKDLYVIGAQSVDGIGYDVQMCSVPMVTAPEIRYVRADLAAAPVELDALRRELEEVKRERDEAREHLAIANRGGLDLLYEIREALGWNDKTGLSLLPSGVRDLRRKAQC